VIEFDRDPGRRLQQVPSWQEIEVRRLKKPVRWDLIHYALLNNSPFEDTIGSGEKVGKEEIVGMVKVLELFLISDQQALLPEYWSRLDYVAHAVSKIPGVSTAYRYNPNQIANHTVGMEIFWDPRRMALTFDHASELLKNGKPSIIMEGGRFSINSLDLSAWMLKPGEEKIIARRVSERFWTPISQQRVQFKETNYERG
jgi:seryl-tRNA(Sec) selenium transferase